MGMAIRHGLAGQYGKVESIKRYRRTIFIALAMVTVSVGLLGFVSGFFWSRNGVWYAVLAMLIAIGAMLTGIRYLDPYMKMVAKERIKFLRGGQAEGLVAWILEDLEDDWHVFNNVMLNPHQDADHVVVGPGGVFCISTKSKRGWFVGSAHDLRHNDRPSAFADEVARQTMQLRDLLKARLGEDPPWIRAVLCVPFGWTDGEVVNGNVWLVHADDLTDRIAPEKPAKKLTKDQVARAVKAMEMIQADAARVYERPLTT